MLFGRQRRGGDCFPTAVTADKNVPTKASSNNWALHSTPWSPVSGAEVAGAQVFWPLAYSNSGWSWNQKTRSWFLLLLLFWNVVSTEFPRWRQSLSAWNVIFVMVFFFYAEPEIAPQAWSQSQWLLFPHPDMISPEGKCSLPREQHGEDCKTNWISKCWDDSSRETSDCRPQGIAS